MITSLDVAKAHLNVTGTADDALITSKIEAAEEWLDRWLPEGEKLADRDPVPADLKQAVLMIVGHWYENREAYLVGITAEEVPLGIWSIVNQHRAWAF